MHNLNDNLQRIFRGDADPKDQIISLSILDPEAELLRALRGNARTPLRNYLSRIKSRIRNFWCSSANVLITLPLVHRITEPTNQYIRGSIVLTSTTAINLMLRPAFYQRYPLEASFSSTPGRIIHFEKLPPSHAGSRRVDWFPNVTQNDYKNGTTIL